MTQICIECGETSEDGEGWKGERAVDLLDEEEPDKVAVYCPECSISTEPASSRARHLYDLQAVLRGLGGGRRCDRPP